MTESEESDNEDDSDRSGGLSRTKADHLYTSLAFLVEAFAEKSPGEIFGDKDKPNVSQISKYLEKRATEANKKEKLNGQGSEAIKKRITEALKIKRSKLPEN